MSPALTFTVNVTSPPPVILVHPASLSAFVNQEAVFGVVADSTATSYQWQKNGVDIAGATGRTYVKGSLILADTGSSFRVKVTGAGGASFSNPATLTVTETSSTTSQLMQNEGFEAGTAGWQQENTYIITNNTVFVPRTGTYYAWLGGYKAPYVDYVYQTIAVPSNATAAQLNFWMTIRNYAGTPSARANVLSLKIRSTAGTVLETLAEWDNRQVNYPAYVQRGPWSLLAYKGQTIQLYLTSTQPGGDYTGTTFLLDDFSLNVTTGGGLVEPSIVQGPASQTVDPGGTASFWVTASGQNLMYQWRKNGLAIAGATLAVHTTPAVQASDNNAQYTVQVTNGAGTVTSPPAILTVRLGPPDYALSVSPSTITTQRGMSGAATLSVTRLNAHAGSISFTLQDPPQGISASGTLGANASSQAFQVSVPAGVVPNTYALRLTGQDSSTPPLVRTADFQLVVTSVPALTVDLTAQVRKGSSVIGTDGKSVVARSGDQLTLQPTVSGGTPPYRWEYRRGETIVSSGGPAASVSTYAVTSLEPQSHSGSYILSVTDSSNPVQSKSSPAASVDVLAVPVRPSLQISAPSPSAVEGTPYTVPIRAFHADPAKPGVNFDLTTRPAGALLQNPTGPGADLVSGTDLVWSQPVAGDHAFSVMATSKGDPTATATLSWTVHVTKGIQGPSIKSLNNADVMPGEQARFTAEVEGTGPFTYEWYVGGQLMARRPSMMAKSDTFVYTVPAAQDQDKLNVRLRVAPVNDASLTTEKEQQISVNTATNEDLVPTRIEVRDGDTKTILGDYRLVQIGGLLSGNAAPPTRVVSLRRSVTQEASETATSRRRHTATYAAGRGRIYVLGGAKTNAVLDVDADQVVSSAFPALNKERWFHGAQLLDDGRTLIAFGGRRLNTDEPENTFEWLDLDASTPAWTTVALSPTGQLMDRSNRPRLIHIAQASDGNEYIFVVGGFDGNQSVAWIGCLKVNRNESKVVQSIAEFTIDDAKLASPVSAPAVVLLDTEGGKRRYFLVGGHPSIAYAQIIDFQKAKPVSESVISGVPTTWSEPLALALKGKKIRIIGGAGNSDGEYDINSGRFGTPSSTCEAGASYAGSAGCAEAILGPGGQLLARPNGTSGWVEDKSPSPAETLRVARIASFTCTPPATSQVVSVLSGQRVTFRAEVHGSGPFSYSWFRTDGGVRRQLAVHDLPSFATPELSSSDNASQWEVVVRGLDGSTDQQSITVHVDAASVPRIVMFRDAGGSFSGTSEGSLTLQWTVSAAPASLRLSPSPTPVLPGGQTSAVILLPKVTTLTSVPYTLCLLDGTGAILDRRTIYIMVKPAGSSAGSLNLVVTVMNGLTAKNPLPSDFLVEGWDLDPISTDPKASVKPRLIYRRTVAKAELVPGVHPQLTTRFGIQLSGLPSGFYFVAADRYSGNGYNGPTDMSSAMDAFTPMLMDRYAPRVVVGTSGGWTARADFGEGTNSSGEVRKMLQSMSRLNTSQHLGEAERLDGTSYVLCSFLQSTAASMNIMGWDSSDYRHTVKVHLEWADDPWASWTSAGDYGGDSTELVLAPNMYTYNDDGTKKRKYRLTFQSTATGTPMRWKLVSDPNDPNLNSSSDPAWQNLEASKQIVLDRLPFWQDSSRTSIPVILVEYR